MHRLLPLCALALACRAGPPPTGAGDLLAAVQDQNSLFLLRQKRAASGFHVERRLPAAARALRFSPDGRSVAWVQDDLSGDQPRMLGFHLAPEAKEPRALGELGLRNVEGGGLAVGRNFVLFTHVSSRLVMQPPGKPVGVGAWPVVGDGALAWLDMDARQRGKCLDLRPPRTRTPLCGAALRPLEARRGAVLYRDNKGLWLAAPDPVRLLPAAKDVVDGRLGPGGRVLAIARRVVDGFTSEALHVGSAADPVLSAPSIVSAEWDDDGAVLAIVPRGAPTTTDRLLAHAPEEFGGEALPGEALRVAPDGGVRPVEGLEGRSVRALFRAR